MKKTGWIAVIALVALVIGIAATPNVGQRRVGWANTITELMSQTPSKDSYVYVTIGNLYSSNYDGVILAYSPTATNAANLTNVWEPDSGHGRWFLIQGSGVSGGGGGSVALTMPDGFTVTGSPIVGSGVINVTTMLNTIIKATGSGFTNAIAGVDYVTPGSITAGGLTMTGTNLLGRYSSGTGPVQSIAAGLGLSISGATISNTYINQTPQFIPYHAGGTFSNSPMFRIDDDTVGITHGTDTNLKLYSTAAFSAVNLHSAGGTNSTDLSMFSLDGGPFVAVTYNNEVPLNIDPFYNNAGSAISPFYFNDKSSTSTNLFRIDKAGTNQFYVATSTGYSSSGTNLFTDDGTYKSLSTLGVPTINATDGYLPYRSGAAVLSDSPIYRIAANSIGIGTTTNALTVSGSILYYTNSSTGIAFQVKDGTGQFAQFGTSAGGHVFIKAATGGDIYFGANNNGSGDWAMNSAAIAPTGNNSADIGSSSKQIKIVYVGTSINWATNYFKDTFGFGSPEGVIAAGIGSTYRDLSGGTNTTFYYKEGGGTGNTGWNPK